MLIMLIICPYMKKSTQEPKVHPNAKICRLRPHLMHATLSAMDYTGSISRCIEEEMI